MHGLGQSCHSWRDCPFHSVTAMTFFFVLLVLAAVAVVASVITVLRDGYRRAPVRAGCATAPALGPNEKWTAV